MRLPRLLSRLFEARSSRLSAISNWSEFLGTGARNAAHVTITPEAAAALPTARSCIKLVSETISALPCKLYRRDSREPATDHPAYPVLARTANAETTAAALRLALVSDLLVQGGCFATVERDRAGRCIGLWRLSARNVRLARDRDRRLTFSYATMSGMQTWTHDPARPPIFFLLLNPSDDGLSGRGPLMMISADTLGAAIAGERFSAAFFGQGSTPGGILTVDSPLDNPEELELYRKQIDSMTSGVERAFRTLVLGAGRDFKPWPVSNEAAQLLGARRFAREQIASAFNVPLALLSSSDPGSVSYGSAEAMRLAFYANAIDPLLVLLEQALEQFVLGREAEDYTVRFGRAASVRTDLATRTGAYARLRQLGVINANEIRAFEELPPIADAAGDAYIVLGGATLTPTEPPAGEPPAR